MNPGCLLISIDVELLWGTSDVVSAESQAPLIRGGLQAIPRILDLFQSHGVRATWAFVGLAACTDIDDVFDVAPSVRPTYAIPTLSNYHFAETTAKALDRQLLFMPEMLRRIGSAPGQELGSHSFSHLYALESGVTMEAFESDLAAFSNVAARLGVRPTSFIFPRNQSSANHFEALAQHGYSAARGNEDHWSFRSSRPRARMYRLADSMLDLSGAHAPRIVDLQRIGNLVNLPASRFLRPVSRTALVNELYFRRVTAAMENAARNGAMFHLWWHPENFGADPVAGVGHLTRVLARFSQLRKQFGFQSLQMQELAAAVGGTPDGN